MKVNLVNTNTINVKGTFDSFKHKRNNSYVQTTIPTLTTNNNKNIENTKTKPISIIIAATMTVAAALVLLNSKKIKNIHELNKQRKILEKQIKSFPEDMKYRSNLAVGIGLKEKDSYKLRSVIGSQEFSSYLDEFSKNPTVYTPGLKSYKTNESAYFKDKKYVENFDFGANLHMHTKHSDGKFEIQDLLDKAAEYGDKRFEKKGKPFVFAITDHDSVDGCKEAVEIISQDPWKYRNIRLVLGIENTTRINPNNMLKDDAQIHLLSYCINPFGKQMDKFLNSRVKQNTDNMKKVLVSVNDTLHETLDKHNLRYSFEELVNMEPSLNSSSKNSAYFMKDYLQFRLIFASMFENNTKLKNFLKKSTDLNLKEVNFIQPIKKISKTPDCSNGRLYCENYYDALKQHIVDISKEANPNIKQEEIIEKFEEVPQYIKNVLNEIEYKTLNPTSDFHVPNVIYPTLKSATKDLSKMDDVVMSIAHPGVFFPKNAVNKEDDIVELYDNVYKIFTQEGNGKAKYAEDYYQIYWNNNNPDVMRELPKLSKKYGLGKTGGLDTHKSEIFETDH